MSILSPETTEFLGIQYPAEDCDPFYDQFVSLVRDLDSILFMRKIMNNLFIGGGGTRSWGGGVLLWTDDFVIPVYHWGKRILVRYGPDGLTRGAGIQDGQCLVVNIPMSMNGDVVINFSVLDSLDQARHDQWVVGWRYGSALQLKGIGELI